MKEYINPKQIAKVLVIEESINKNFIYKPEEKLWFGGKTKAGFYTNCFDQRLIECNEILYDKFNFIKDNKVYNYPIAVICYSNGNTDSLLLSENKWVLDYIEENKNMIE